MGEFLRSVGLHRAALERCIQLATGLDGSEKPLALLESTVRQLRQLEGCRSWDELYHHPGVDFGRLNFPQSLPGRNPERDHQGGAGCLQAGPGEER